MDAKSEIVYNSHRQSKGGFPVAVIRRIQKQTGRISIPKSVLRSIGAETGDVVQLSLERDEEGPYIVITKSSLHCYICGDPLIKGKYTPVGDKNVCNTCLTETMKGKE